MRFNNILLIDDDVDDQEIFEAALQSASVSVQYQSISSAELALAQLNSGQINPDIIFLDLNMPVMDGRRFLTEVKKMEALRPIPIVVISTASHPETIFNVKKLGAAAFVTKPNSFDELVTILDKVLENGTTFL
ncbi:MAG: response regulator [Chitinophagaceae bacterium]|nr:MAG: response regulator [Chitinophagaceae bacterium]